MDRFREILNDLGDLLGLPLYPDRLGACKLNMEDKCHVQIEYQPHKQRLLLACMICEIPPGKFREKVLKDALKANGFHSPEVLCYSEKNNHLCLFEMVSLEYLNGQKLMDSINHFTEKAIAWRMGIETGRTDTLVSKKP
ncbi:MAG: CesT family type III secretion system chaperone [Chlamydiales bacterium]|nr:CesT family type III secretion system chaperone [Chlamydiales bacterium]